MAARRGYWWRSAAAGVTTALEARDFAQRAPGSAAVKKVVGAESRGAGAEKSLVAAEAK
jgi:hypothetical protein